MQTAKLATTLTKLGGLAAVGAWVAWAALSVATAAPPVRSVEQLDMQRYSGMWYELARLPNSLQANCVADVTATYRLLDDGSLQVIQRCREAGQGFSVAAGRAVTTDGDPSGARLKLSFLPTWLQWLPTSHDEHWIVMIDDDYRYAVVSQPSRERLWILARTPTLDPVTFDSIIARLRAQKYPVGRLVPTPQRASSESPALAARHHLIV